MKAPPFHIHIPVSSHAVSLTESRSLSLFLSLSLSLQKPNHNHVSIPPSSIQQRLRYPQVGTMWRFRRPRWYSAPIQFFFPLPFWLFPFVCHQFHLNGPSPFTSKLECPHPVLRAYAPVFACGSRNQRSVSCMGFIYRTSLSDSADRLGRRLTTVRTGFVGMRIILGREARGPFTRWDQGCSASTQGMAGKESRPAWNGMF